jgi:hypothetical protein
VKRDFDLRLPKSFFRTFGRIHFERLKEAFAHKIGIRFTGSLLDNHSEQKIVRIAVMLLRSSLGSSARFLR